MSGRTEHSSEQVRNQAQQERAAADEDRKKFADTADFADKETWGHPAGHSGTRRAWAVSTGMLASFLLAGAGLTFGPRVLLWIGIGLFVVLGALGFTVRVWTDYVREKKRIPADQADRKVDQRVRPTSNRS
jgi:Flp pilus assembly protein TadB